MDFSICVNTVGFPKIQSHIRISIQEIMNFQGLVMQASEATNEIALWGEPSVIIGQYVILHN